MADTTASALPAPTYPKGAYIDGAVMPEDAYSAEDVQQAVRAALAAAPAAEPDETTTHQIVSRALADFRTAKGNHRGDEYEGMRFAIMQDRSRHMVELHRAGMFTERPAPAVEAQPVMTTREAVCIMAINSALLRIQHGRASDAVGPLERARAMFDAAAPAQPVARNDSIWQDIRATLRAVVEHGHSADIDEVDAQRLLDLIDAPAQPVAPAVEARPVNTMTNHRAAWFLERFKHEEKMLGPNEQAALEHAIAVLESAAPEAPRPAPLTEKQMVDCVCSIGLPVPMGLTRDSGPYEVTGPTWFLIQLIRAVERAHGITGDRP